MCEIFVLKIFLVLGRLQKFNLHSITVLKIFWGNHFRSVWWVWILLTMKISKFTVHVLRDHSKVEGHRQASRPTGNQTHELHGKHAVLPASTPCHAMSYDMWQHLLHTCLYTWKTQPEEFKFPVRPYLGTYFHNAKYVKMVRQTH